MKYQNTYSIGSNSAFQSSKSGHQNTFLSNTSKKPEYSIKSIPHQISHSKNAFKDYFKHPQELDDQVSQECSRVNVNQSLIKKNKLSNNYYANQQSRAKNKIPLPLKLKEIAHKKLIFSMNQLKNKEPVYKTAQKLPTFRDSTIKGKIAQSTHGKTTHAQQSNITVSQKLVGKIAHQNLDRNSRLKIASRNKFLEKESVIKYEKYMPVINKLLHIQGLFLFEKLLGQQSNQKQQKQSRLNRTSVKSTNSVYIRSQCQ